MRNLKRALSLALASVMLLGMMVVGTSASYADVSSKNNLEAIEVLKAVGVMTGDDKGNFNPDANVTRNEMAVIMCNLLGLKAGGSHPFTDVPAWAAPYVAACYNNGIIAGVSADKFNGDANVTAVQAGLMVMKALGYFGYQGEFGDNWKLSTVKQANEIDLYKGINAYTDQDMTRNEVAQMVLNALQATVMVVREEGGLSVDGNGISVNQKPRYDKTPADNKSGYDYANRSDATMQLCEKLYGNDLKKNTSGASDAFGRTSTQWTYKSTTITTPDAATLTYTDEVKIKDIFADLGKPGTLNGNAFNFVDAASTPNKCTVDGADGQDGTAAIAAPYNTSSVKLGGNGATVEVYYDRTTNEARLVVVNTYVAKVTKVAKNADGKYDVTLNVMNKGTLTDNDIEVAGDIYAKDDIVLITKINSEIKSIEKAQKVTGEVTAVKGDGSYIKVDGTQYNTAVKYYNFSSSNTTIPGVDAKLVAYVDANGNLYAVDAQDAVKDYLYVVDAIDALDGLTAKVVFADGTEKKIDIVKVDSTEGATLTVGDVTTAGQRIFTYTVDNNEYTLTGLGTTNQKYTTTGSDGTITKGSANILVDYVDGSTGDVKFVASNKTVFVDVDNNKAYIGYKNVPSYTGVTMYAVKDATSGLTDIVYITAGVDTTSANTIFYVKSASYEETKVDGSVYREYTVYVNGVEQKLTTKGMTAAASLTDDDSTLQADTLYVAKSITADGYLTSFDTTKSFAVTGDFDNESNGNVTVAKDGVLSLASATNDKSGANKSTFTYDDKTVFMVVTDKKGTGAPNKTTDTVEVGSVSNIVLDGGYVAGQDSESIVYVLSVDDKTDDTPMATLVLVVVPQA